jgi:hypothetical protein
MSNPLITIIIPLYNHEKYIGTAIESVLAQTYRRREIIVVDDGSTDMSPSIAKSFEPGVRYLRKENAGCASAFNLGVREASGEWIAWLSSDDRWLPRKLDLQMAALSQSNDPVLCYSDDYLIDSSGNRISRRYLPSYNSTFARRVSLLRRCFVSGSSVLASKTALLRAGLFDENDMYTHDYGCWLRLACQGDWIHLREPLVESRVHPGQVSANFKAMEKSATALAFASARKFGPVSGAAGCLLRIADSLALIPMRAASRSEALSQWQGRIDPLALLPWQTPRDRADLEMSRQLVSLFRDLVLLVSPGSPQPTERGVSPTRQ